MLDFEGGRARIGPVIGSGANGCRHCLQYWLDHNRPDRELWAEFADKLEPVPVSAEMPWTGFFSQTVKQAAIDYLTLRDFRSFVDVSFQPVHVERHGYLTAPHCPTCSSSKKDAPEQEFLEAGALPKLSADTYRTSSKSLDGSRLRAAYVSYRSGLVKHMYRDSSSVMLPMWVAETNVSGTSIVEAGYGRHESAQKSEAIAILEALERFCGQSPRSRHGFLRASFSECLERGLNVADPQSMILCPEAQRGEPSHNLQAFSPDQAYDWIWGYSLLQDEAVLVPLQFGFYSQRLTDPQERFVQESSNGCALGNSRVEAIFHGLLETIERDAYMTRWHVKGEPVRLDLESCASAEIRNLHARAKAQGFELFAFDIGIEAQLPTVLAMIVDPDDDAPVKSYCASACNPVARDAIYAAIVEVTSSIAVYQGQFGKERKRARELYEDGSRATEMRDHVLLYSLPETIERLDFLDRKAAPVDADRHFADMERNWGSTDLKRDLDTLIKEVAKVSDDIIVIDQTAEHIEQIGLHCVKTLAPGMHPVTFGHQYRRISKKRLQSARDVLAAKGERVVEGENPFPHNFP
nr:TOMM precursor leader peptide-binding protein [Erythrobacter crassostrea]